MQQQNSYITADFLHDLFDALPDAVTYLVPLYTDGKITDFEIRYMNDTVTEYSGKMRVMMLGKRILEHQQPSVSSCKDVFDKSLEVFTSGRAVTATYYNAYIGAEITLIRKRFREGVLSVTRSIKLVKA